MTWFLLSLNCPESVRGLWSFEGYGANRRVKNLILNWKCHGIAYNCHETGWSMSFVARCGSYMPRRGIPKMEIVKII